MREMKDSGVEWLGKVPEKWVIVRMKNCVSSRDGGAWGEDAKHNDNDVICLRIADFDYSKFRFKDLDAPTIRNYKDDVIKRLSLRRNDILIEKSGGGDKTPVGRAVLFDKDYPALFANFMDRIRVNNRVTPAYYLYILTTFYYNEYVWNYIKQTTGIQNLDLTSMLSNERLALPSIEEQKQITDYLDYKCNQIDSIISKQEAIIEKLKEYKSSIINESIKIKVVGNELVTSEEYKKIKFGECMELLTDYHSNGSYETLAQNVTLLDEESYALMVRTLNLERNDFAENVIYINEHAYNFLAKSKVYGDEIIINKIGSAGKVYYMPNLGRPVSLAMNQFLIRIKKDYVSKYVYYYLHTKYAEEQIAQRVKGAVTQTITKDAVRSIPVLVPNYKEQERISNYLDIKVSLIDEKINSLSVMIDKIKEYRKSLIYEVITGKKEV